MNSRRSLTLGAICCFLSVFTGAFAAHALKGRLDEPHMLNFKLASTYLIYHGLALLAWGLLTRESREMKFYYNAGNSFALGTFIFCFSLFAYALSDIKVFAHITPLGGSLLLWAWIQVIIFLSKSSNAPVQ